MSYIDFLVYGLPVYEKNKGRTVKIQIRYSHLGRVLVRDGDYVFKGQEIGEVGEPEQIFGGRTTGRHLDMELTIDGKKYNQFSNSTYNREVVL